MLYMVIEHFRNRDAVPVYRRFRDEGRLAPDGLHYVSSWVDTELARCFQVMECDNRALLDQWIARWTDLVDFEVVEVMTSGDVAARIGSRIDSQPQEMVMDDIETLRYPVGRFSRLTTPLDRATRSAHIDTIEQTPARFRSLVNGRSDAELDTPYRPGGWTVRQVVHHVPDSHMNAYIRMKWAITEEAPAIKVYHEERWAELPEAKTGPAEMSVALLEALHRRWVAFLRALPDAEFGKAYVHPELGRVTLDEGLALYAWHCRHHAAHIELGLNAAKT